MASRSQPECAATPATSGSEPSAAFTPGPWVTGYRFGVESLVQTPGKYPIAITDILPRAAGVQAEQEANARLIAAAPDMAEAGEELSAAVADLAPHFSEPVAHFIHKWQRLDRAQKGWRAAIAKSLGTSETQS